MIFCVLLSLRLKNRGSKTLSKSDADPLGNFFSYCHLNFLSIYVSIFCVFIIFPHVSDSLSLLLYSSHVRLLRALIKINQSINQSNHISAHVGAFSRIHCKSNPQKVHHRLILLVLSIGDPGQITIFSARCVR